MKQNSAETHKKKSNGQKIMKVKKAKRFSPYMTTNAKRTNFDETQLLETHVQMVSKGKQWILVTSPNKLLIYK